MLNSLSDRIDEPSCPGAFGPPAERAEPEAVAKPPKG